MFIAQTLNVNVMEYGIYAVFNYTVPIISVIFGYIGYKIITINEEEYKQFKDAEAL
ncbi:Na+ H+ antiporter [Staphylococcus aureus]|nr:Na+ H+ antiporter [Staphylococcus aureus]